jgi:hypothetical protein
LTKIDSLLTLKKNLNFIYTLIALDIMSDIAFLNSILAPKQEEDTDKHPLIGKRYVVTDSSYAIDKESGVEVSGLNDKEYVIVSDPYVAEIESSWTGNKYERMFVDVFSLRSARKYRVLFREKDVVED